MEDKKRDITENKVVVENGEVKTVLSEDVDKNEFMDLEEARKLLHEMIRKEYSLK
jgi:hypothetical protein